jgi:hypothetical protein
LSANSLAIVASFAASAGASSGLAFHSTRSIGYCRVFSSMMIVPGGLF